MSEFQTTITTTLTVLPTDTTDIKNLKSVDDGMVKELGNHGFGLFIIFVFNIISLTLSLYNIVLTMAMSYCTWHIKFLKWNNWLL